MTQISYPWPGTTLTDAGPYSSEQWNSLWGAGCRSGVKFGRSADYSIGVFYALGNHLDPTINSTDLDVDTGGALVDGLYFESDATVSIDVGGVGTRPAANPRIDYIVVRKNYSTTTTYSPTAGPAVAPQTARLTVIRGTEAGSPVAPSLTQDTTRTTYWDVPIATVQVSTGGVLSNLVDQREFVDAETKQFFVPALVGANVAVETDLKYFFATGESFGPYIELNHTSNPSSMVGRFIVPSDFIESMTAKVSILTTSSGNIYLNNEFRAASCGEDYDTHTGSTGYSAESATLEQYACLQELSITSIVSGDYVWLRASRNGTNVADTISDSVSGLGWYVEYFGWKK